MWPHCFLRNIQWNVQAMQLNFMLHSFSYISLNHVNPATSNFVEASTTSQSKVSMEGSVSLPLPASSSLPDKTIYNAIFVTIISTFHIFVTIISIFHIFFVTDTWYLSRWIMAECLKAYFGETGFDDVDWSVLVRVGPKAVYCDYAVEWVIFLESK
jgi:hypothetical protein